LDRRSLLYLASDPDGSGLFSTAWMSITYSSSSGFWPGRYTSLAASADGHRLVATLASLKRTLWSLPITNLSSEVSSPTLISLTTGTGFSPRLGPNYLLYVSATSTAESIWKIVSGASTELWSGKAARILGARPSPPMGAISHSRCAERTIVLYVMQTTAQTHGL
jgi:hypothetical protein